MRGAFHRRCRREIALMPVARVVADLTSAPAGEIGRGKFHVTARRDRPLESAASAGKLHEPARPRRAHAEQFGIEQHRRRILLIADLDGDALGRDLPVDVE